jgi:predicted ABC-type ATPase
VGKGPSLVVVSGPNGAGKSTAAPKILRDTLAVSEFVNADLIAQGLSAYDPLKTAIAAGRLMLNRIHELAGRRLSFAFETTLASRSFVPWLKELRKDGYTLHLIFFWLPDADFACARVAARVLAGGHSVPEDTVRRRYRRGLVNFFDLYRPLATTWRIYDNSSSRGPSCVARGTNTGQPLVFDEETWNRIESSVREAR